MDYEDLRLLNALRAPSSQVFHILALKAQMKHLN